MAEKTYDVYVLIDPLTARVFYVGISDAADRRMDQHVNGTHPSTSEPIDNIKHAYPVDTYSA